MSRNYEVSHYIQNQMSDYKSSLTNAVIKLFNTEDKLKQMGGCVIDSVALLLILKQYGINAELHLGEVCADGEQDAYHCWLTVDNKIVDIGIYGNSNYNPYFKGKKLEHPILFEKLEDISDIVYCNGSTETDSWLSKLSELSVLTYIKNCPDNRVCKLICKALDISEIKPNFEKIYKLADGLFFPKLEKIDESPSGRHGV